MFANQKGGYLKHLTVFSEEALTQIMFKKIFLKKAQLYTCQVTDFILSKSIPIHTFDNTIRIVPLDGVAFGNYYRTKDHVFSGSFYTVADFVVRLQAFLRNFSALYSFFGHGNHLGDNPSNLLQQAQKNTFHVNMSEAFLQQDANPICACSLTYDNRLKLILQKDFTSNFYLDISQGLQVHLGLPPHIFQITDDDEDVFSDATHVLGDIPARVEQQANLAAYTRYSTQGIQNIDTRQSIDIVSTLPVSNKISSLNGVETHDIIMCKIPFNKLQFFQGQFKFLPRSSTLAGMEIVDRNFVGIQNLSRGNPNFVTTHMLTSNIQFLRFHLKVRYFENGAYAEKDVAFQDGFWVMKLLFSKKV